MRYRDGTLQQMQPRYSLGHCCDPYYMLWDLLGPPARGKSPPPAVRCGGNAMYAETTLARSGAAIHIANSSAALFGFV